MTELRIAHLPDRALIEVAGPEAEAFLQGLVSNDVAAAGGDREAVYAALLTPQGKFLHDMVLARPAGAGDGAWLLDCAAAARDDLLKRLKMYRLRARVELTDRSAELAVLALFPAGPGGEAAAPAMPPAAVALYRDPRLPELGWRAAVPSAALDAFGPVDATEEDYDRHRLALAVPDGARDIEPGKGLLLESNFEELHGVDFGKGCYVGQELTARTKHRALVKKRLWGVRGPAPLPAAGTQILLDGQDAGQMGSSRDGRGLALLRLDKLRASLAGGGRLLAEGVELQPERPPYLPDAILQGVEEKA